MIKIKELTKTFKTQDGELDALKDINVLLPQKGMVFVIGKSGSGKSTLLNLIAGFDKPSEGSIEVNGEIISEYNENELAHYQFETIGFVFQNYSLIEELSVEENIAIGLKTKSSKLKDEIEDVLIKVGLEGYQERKVSKLSGGEKQRVAIARAILKNPEIILCDEPCGNLDNVSSKLVLDILKSISKTSLVLVVSHNLNDAYYYGDRVISLDHGIVIKDEIYNGKAYEKFAYECINDFNSLSKEELARINNNLATGTSKGILRRKDCFIPYQNQDTGVEPCQEKEERKGHFLFSILSLINRNKVKISVFTILIALVLSLFSICFSIQNFDSSAFFLKAYDEENYDTLVYNKGGQSEGDLETNILIPFDEEDEEFIASSGYEGNYYPLMHLYLQCYSNSEYLRNDYAIVSNIFQYFFSKEIGGLLLCPESFIKQNLGLEELNITYSDTLYESGILITDYIADSIRYFKPNTYPTRESILGMSASPFGNDHVYINGIIETGYEKRLASFQEAFEESGNNMSLLLDEEYLDDYEYIKNALNIAYSTNMDFLDTYDYVKDLYSKRWLVEDGTGLLSLEKGAYPVTYCTALEEGEIMLRSKYFVEEVYKDLDAAMMEENLNSYSSITLSSYNGAYPSYSELIEKTSYPVDKIYICENNNGTLWSKETCGRYDSTYIFVNPSMYEQIKRKSFYTMGYYFDNVQGALSLRESLLDRDIYLNSTLATALTDVSQAISTFGSTFQILSIISAVIAFLIIAFYGISIVRSNRYNIGVLKALGFNGGELTRYYLVSLAVFFVFISLFYLLFYNLFLYLINNVLFDALTSISQKVMYFKSFGLFDFNPQLFLVIFLLFVGITLLISLLYLFVLRKIRAIKILQNKE